ncbi:MAG: 30S ribosomal protein S12 methylthiotransferase RimO [Rikenellaceae bacterium]|nr:30S ribosomal protein S12 methylthiotransferase RimO [Rikenellaceae bacterium]MCL2692198.1 30S ribosomal protein S12 methylthiotransferase RimO [Rikenellaceae bacterium]
MRIKSFAAADKSRARVNIITLGCAKNVVDSEHIGAQLAAAGREVIYDTDEPAAVVILNTCGFIGDAKEESVNTILAAAARRTNGDIERLYVMGCLSQRYADELRAEIPEVDGWFGARTIDDVVRALDAEWREELATTRLLSTPPHYAYLKIGEGCNWNCAFCAIPLIRGRHRSRPVEQLVEEARNLAAKGVKELIVIAQDTTFYGVDLYGERRLAHLLRELCRVEGIEWVRLHYTYPAGFPDDVIEAIATEPKICKYIDIPLQHISDSQLSSMRRGITTAETRALIERLRAAIPGIAIRTTLIVGYPGETDADFVELVDFVRETRFDRLGVFPYSEEEGTAAARLADDVPSEVKEQRIETIMQLQARISFDNNVRREGAVEHVIIDRREGEFYVARSQYDSPEVDQEILIPVGDTKCRLRPGTFHAVRITAAEEYDLYGEII